VFSRKFHVHPHLILQALKKLKDMCDSSSPQHNVKAPARNAKGQFTRSIDALNEQSAVCRIVDEEVDVFLNRLKERLNDLDASAEWQANNSANAKRDVLEALKARFGVAIATQLAGGTRRASGWNQFCQDHFRQAKSETEMQHTGQKLSMYLQR
jgi:hypothetical protein